MLAYAETRPDIALRRHVHSFWAWDADLPPGERFDHHVWPDGCVSVVVSRRHDAPPTGLIVGPCVEPHQIAMSGRVRSRGVRYRPEAGAALLGLRAHELAGRTLPLRDALGNAAAIELIAAVDAPETHAAAFVPLRRWVRGRLAASPPLDDVVTQAVDAIRDAGGQLSIAELAARLEVGPRQLQRRFLAAVGLSPKQYARIRRLRSLLALVMASGDSWARLAADSGYADQAHCARDLARLTGLSPRALAARLRVIQHGDVDP